MSNRNKTVKEKQINFVCQKGQTDKHKTGIFAT